MVNDVRSGQAGNEKNRPPCDGRFRCSLPEVSSDQVLSLRGANAQAPRIMASIMHRLDCDSRIPRSTARQLESSRAVASLQVRRRDCQCPWACPPVTTIDRRKRPNISQTRHTVNQLPVIPFTNVLPMVPARGCAFRRTALTLRCGPRPILGRGPSGPDPAGLLYQEGLRVEDELPHHV